MSAHQVPTIEELDLMESQMKEKMKEAQKALDVMKITREAFEEMKNARKALITPVSNDKTMRITVVEHQKSSSSSVKPNCKRTCMNYEETGNCENARNGICDKLHEIRQHYYGKNPPTCVPGTTCEAFNNGGCIKGNKCLLAHDPRKGKQKLCVSYKRFGECFKPNCCLHHLFFEKKEPIYRCYYHFMMNKCNNGDNCSFKHDQENSIKPRCRYFDTLRGCNNGDDCIFSHSS